MSNFGVNLVGNVDEEHGDLKKMDKWKKNSGRNKVCKINTSTILSLSLLLFLSFLTYYSVPTLRSTRSTSSTAIIAGELPQCTAKYKHRPGSLRWLPKDEKYIWFAPHSGFSNQVSELKNALLIAGILNRTLIIPPIMDHHAVALGSCPKFRVQPAHELRSSVWDHINSLMQNSRYVSMVDIIDLSGVISSSLVKVIDFRIFVSLWCGLDIRSSCSGSLCHSLAEAIQAWGSYKKCGELLSGLIKNAPHCVYGVEEDCRTTVWTYQEEFDNLMDSFQPDDNLRIKKKIDYIRKRRNIDKALGHGSNAYHATVLLFGTLFTAPYKGSELYIDIHKAPKDERIASLLEKIEFLPFAPEIINAGKKFAREKIKEPFLCAQLRLLDGQFKNHWQTSFSALKGKLKNVQNQFQGKLKSVDIFLMTDLPETNWTGTYFGDLAADSRSYKLHVLNEKDDFVVNTARKLITREYGFRSGAPQQFLKRVSTSGKYPPRVLPDILLYIEETICSCASVGFVGTVGSTIADNIEQMRKHNVCSISLD